MIDSIRMKKNDIEKFSQALKITQTIVGVNFLAHAPKNNQAKKDTACTALARVFIKREDVYFNATTQPQLCSGANYFLKLGTVSDREAIGNYVADEQVFANEAVCKTYLKSLPKFPQDLQQKTIAIKSLEAKDKPAVVIMLLNPAQVGRVLGLLNYSEYRKIEISPNQSTCISLFSPLATGQPHLNFIDYYDRYYQGRAGQKYLWPEGMMLLSVTGGQFEKIVANLDKSAQGSFVPKIKPQKIDKI